MFPSVCDPDSELYGPESPIGPSIPLCLNSSDAGTTLKTTTVTPIKMKDSNAAEYILFIPSFLDVILTIVYSLERNLPALPLSKQ
jgi:hypothetical protein